MQPILSTGKRVDQSGFTLLELMLVVIVVGLVASVVTLSLPSKDGRQLIRESERIRYLLRNTQQHAIFSGQDVGISVTAHRLASVIHTDQGWQQLTGNTSIELPESLHMMLDIEGQPVQLHTTKQLSTIQPQLLFTSDGQHQPFSFQLSDNQHRTTIDSLYEVE